MHDYLRPLGEIGPLRDPVLIASFSGWNDFGGAASATLRYLSRQWEARQLVEIDPEPFFDFTVQRPTVHVAADERVIRWPRNRFEVASPEGSERDFLLLRGTEPHLKWRTFLELITEVMDATGATTSITVAAQPAAVPHTRPLPVSLSASDNDFEEQFGLKVPESRYEGPTGIVGVLNLAQRDLGRAQRQPLGTGAALPDDRPKPAGDDGARPRDRPRLRPLDGHGRPRGSRRALPARGRAGDVRVQRGRIVHRGA